MKGVFIPICTANAELHLEDSDTETPIAIFDIDYTLFNSPEMYKFEFNNVTKEFLSKPGSSSQLLLDSLPKYCDITEPFYKHFGIHPSKCCRFLNTPPLDEFIKPCKKLKQMIDQLNIPKICYTNASVARAKYVLEYLGLDGSFDAILCYDDTGVEFITKPKEASLEFVENFVRFRASRPIFFFDDTPQNIQKTKARGWKAYHVKNNLTDILNGLLREKLIN